MSMARPFADGGGRLVATPASLLVRKDRKRKHSVQMARVQALERYPDVYSSGLPKPRHRSHLMTRCTLCDEGERGVSVTHIFPAVVEARGTGVRSGMAR